MYWSYLKLYHIQLINSLFLKTKDKPLIIVLLGDKERLVCLIIITILIKLVKFKKKIYLFISFYANSFSNLSIFFYHKRAIEFLILIEHIFTIKNTYNELILIAQFNSFFQFPVHS